MEHTHTHTHTVVHSFLRELRLEREQIDDTPRDVGASLNALLAQNYRKLSMRASMVRRQSTKKVSTLKRDMRMRVSKLC